MDIHAPTVFVILLLGYGMLAVQVTLFRHETSGTVGLRTWNLGSWTLLTGCLLLALQGNIAAWLSDLWGNAFLLLGITLYIQAIYLFLHGHNAPAVVWWGCVLGCISLLFLLNEPGSRRIVVVSALMATLLLPSLREIARLRNQRAYPLRMVGVTLGVAALALGLRAFDAWQRPQDYGMQPSSAWARAWVFPLRSCHCWVPALASSWPRWSAASSACTSWRPTMA